jgi:hypothetical protein
MPSEKILYSKYFASFIIPLNMFFHQISVNQFSLCVIVIVHLLKSAESERGRGGGGP